MKSTYNSSGFSLVELLVVIVSLAVILGMSGQLSPKAFFRRGVDNMTSSISNTLLKAKLSAARDGVEYRVEFADTTSGEVKFMEMKTTRGDSNNNSSSFKQDEQLQKLDIKIKYDPDSMEMSSMPTSIEFNPNGSSEGSTSVVITPSSALDIKRCGQVSVESFGKIRTIKGNWDGTNCSQVQDN